MHEIIPLLRGEIPICDGTITQIFPHEDVQTSDQMPHHTVPDDDDLLETAEDVAHLFGGEPTHVAATRHIRSIHSDTAARRHGREHGLAVVAERRERRVEVRGRDVARATVLVAGEGVLRVWETIVNCFSGLKGGTGYLSGIEGRGASGELETTRLSESQ